MSQVREPTTHNWRLSPTERALHIWFTTFSLSEVLRLTGRSSRCCRQNSRWVAGAAVAREAGARATAAGTMGTAVAKVTVGAATCLRLRF